MAQTSNLLWGKQVISTDFVSIAKKKEKEYESDCLSVLQAKGEKYEQSRILDINLVKLGPILLIIYWSH